MSGLEWQARNWGALRMARKGLSVFNTTKSLEKTLMLGKIEGGRRRGQQRLRWLDGITDSMDTLRPPSQQRCAEAARGAEQAMEDPAEARLPGRGLAERPRVGTGLL